MKPHGMGPRPRMPGTIPRPNGRTMFVPTRIRKSLEMRRGRQNIFPGCQAAGVRPLGEDRGPDAWSSGASRWRTRVQTEAHRGLLPPFAFRDFATLGFTAPTPDP